MVRLDRTFSNYISSGDTRCAGCYMHKFERFMHFEPHRTFSNYILTELARYIHFFHTSSDGSTGPNLLKLHLFRGYKVCRVLFAPVLGGFKVQGALVREVQATRTSSNLLELHSQRASKVNRLLSHEFGVVRLDRTFSNYISSGVQGTICTPHTLFPR